MKTITLYFVVEYENGVVGEIVSGPHRDEFTAQEVISGAKVDNRRVVRVPLACDLLEPL